MSFRVRIGDTVKTTGGGPTLTVAKFDGDGAYCTWKYGSSEHMVWVSFACMTETGKQSGFLKSVLPRQLSSSPLNLPANPSE